MTFPRTTLLGAALSAAVVMTLIPDARGAELRIERHGRMAASAHRWVVRERDDAFQRLACWYAGGPSSVPGPAPTFGYGGPSCWDAETLHKYRHLLPHRRVAARPAAASKKGESESKPDENKPDDTTNKPDATQSKPAETPSK